MENGRMQWFLMAHDDYSVKSDTEKKQIVIKKKELFVCLLAISILNHVLE